MRQLKKETLLNQLREQPEVAAEFLLQLSRVGVLQEQCPTFNITIAKKTKKVKNLLNKDGPAIEIDIDTPAYMDPSCESYHSM